MLLRSISFVAGFFQIGKLVPPATVAAIILHQLK
jgi:hypothetical protein